MLIRPDNDAVNHHVFVVVICGQMTKDPFDATAFTPAVQTAMYVFPVPETGRKVTPGDACTVTIQHGFHKQTVVRSRAADMTFTTGKKILYPLPLIIA